MIASLNFTEKSVQTLEVTKNKGLSLRYKFLLLLTALPLLALATYLFMAIKVFEDDKIAYVFDTSSSVARTVSSQVKAELSSVIKLSKPIVNGYDFTSDKLTDFAKQLFRNEKTFSMLVFYKTVAGGQLRRTETLVVDNDPFEQATKKTIANLKKGKKQLYKALRNIKDNEIKLFSGLSADDRLLVGIRFGKRSDEKSLLVLALINTQNIVPVFQSRGSTSVYLIDNSGRVYLGPDSKLKNLGELVGDKFVKSLKTKKNPEGAEEIQTSDKTTALVSYSPVGLGGLVTAAMVDKTSALRAVEILIKKSLLFFVALLSGTIIVSIFASGTLTSSLSSLYQATLKVAEGKFDLNIKVKSNDEVGALASGFNTMAQEVKRLMMETAEKARMEGELKTAQTVQETLFPPKVASIEKMKIAGHYQPASECGGDWWHYCKVGRKVFVWIGDATGHGAPAALITSAAKSAATIIESLEVSPSQAMRLLNRSIYEVSRGQLMMTFFLGSFDLDSGEFVYCNASHDPPFLFEKCEGALKKKHLIPLNEVNNPRLGQEADREFMQTSLQIEPGTSIFLYTDGIPELHNANGEMWGERNFIKALLKSNVDQGEPEIAVEQMIGHIAEFKGQAPLEDDVTFFQMKLSEV